MPDSHLRRKRRRVFSELSMSLGLAAIIVFFILSGAVSSYNTRTLHSSAQDVAATHEMLMALERLMSSMKDVETGQRGYLLTGDEKYLDPYKVGLQRIDELMANVEKLMGDDQTHKLRLPSIRSNVDFKLKEMAQTIEMRRTVGLAPALEIVRTDRGRQEMNELREQVSLIRDYERKQRETRMGEVTNSYNTALASGIVTGILGVLLSIAVTYLIWRTTNQRLRQEWLQSGEVGLGNALLGEQRMEQLGTNMLGFMASYLDAHAGVFYSKENGSFSRMATYGVANDREVVPEFTSGEGLLGKVARDGKTVLMRDVPEGYITVGSSLGKGAPRHLIIMAAQVDGVVNAVIELGFMHPIREHTLELLERLAEPVGVAVRSANYRLHLQNLLEETQRQAEEMQAQGEELRVSNEELEEQSRVLKESQSRLEQQQIELEQTNAQLEEQTQILEVQRDELEEAKSVVQLKAQELERASQYKSDFLANMSHELRTPLNSSLILAKLLGDNPAGNLSDEQVTYARTIQSAGNDLLTLINDILDLSKIEAGHMEIRSEQVTLSRMSKDVSAQFEPLAKEKGITFAITIDDACPKQIVTDRQRLEQVLKNLLSNALKFTEKGSVSLAVTCHESFIRFAVTDTGIGIPYEQQRAIFDAFRQADGTISRKYGGTGLGLSISRELARLLGGTIELSSEQGKGSTFSVNIPQRYDAALVQPQMHARFELPEESSLPAVNESAVLPQPSIEDDRDVLKPHDRIILVIEDDESFAQILYDLAKEMGFRCLVAATAEEALVVAHRYKPHAVVLDVGLPDHSGLSVLDRLKRDVRTRHIPVHVISAGDYMQTALSLGAIGYMLKPVKREELAEAFRHLESQFAERMRSILIVEDDPVQRDSVAKLLGSAGVKTVGAGTANECLERLREESFDCIVLDLTLPDASGYSLLETLSKEHDHAFPPVIVYTGRDLSVAEEQKLRRYSKSIIIKGAKSPERLLDEVTLFLHQVVAELPADKQRMLEKARSRDAILEGRHILVVEDDVRNVYALTNILEPRGAVVHIARNGREALDMLAREKHINLVLMDVMMPEMDGMAATREIRARKEWKKLPVIMLTAKAMKDDQERCIEAGANDYMAKPLDVEKLLSLIRVWMPR